ncbi:hypothetical protein ACHMWL_20000, partial [Aeromonas caviae]|uniref:hypothetical protein n=1 Tax=Aeromonas caviae TaxID=648 RepID=UPI0037553745
MFFLRVEEIIRLVTTVKFISEISFSEELRSINRLEKPSIVSFNFDRVKVSIHRNSIDTGKMRRSSL